jgi:hypothetical protein
MRKQEVIAAFFSLEAIEWVPRELAVSDRRQTHPLAGSLHQARPNCTVRPDPECTQNRLLIYKATSSQNNWDIGIENSAQDRPIHIDRNGLRLRYYIFLGGRGTNRTVAPLAVRPEKSKTSTFMYDGVTSFRGNKNSQVNYT